MEEFISEDVGHLLLQLWMVAIYTEQSIAGKKPLGNASRCLAQGIAFGIGFLHPEDKFCSKDSILKFLFKF